jgi:hypothetical protein
MLQDQVPLTTTITCKMQNNIDYKLLFLKLYLGDNLDGFGCSTKQLLDGNHI